MDKVYVITDGTIITMDAQDRFYTEDTALCVKGELIVDIIAKSEARKKYPDAEVIDATGKIVLPGFVNAHMHSNLTRGFGDNLSLYKWHDSIAEKVSMEMTSDEVYLGAIISYLEALKTGTTTFLCMEKYSEVCYQAALESKARVRIVPYILDFPDCVDTLELNREYVEKTIKSDSLVKFWFGFDSFREAGDNLITDVVSLSKEYGVGMHTHSNESLDDIQLCKDMHGVEPIEHLYSLGVLSERTVLAHCVHLSEKEKQLMQQTGTKVAHCCVSNLKLCDGIAPIVDYLDRGIQVALGTDGANSSNSYDLFQEMKTAVLAQRARENRADAVVAEQVLRFATIGGAEVLGMDDEIGSLEVGKRADIILVNMLTLHSLPCSSSFPSILKSHLVFSSRGADVDTVMIDGNLVMKNGVLLHVDEFSLIREANIASTGLTKRLRAKNVL
jgi:5-methylthioadenosine/S-adenosylhomocysteine deaminase